MNNTCTLDEMQCAAEWRVDNPQPQRTGRIARAMLEEIRQARKREEANRRRARARRGGS